MEAEEAIAVVDKLVQVDNISATSTKELATALRYSAASADQAGVSWKRLSLILQLYHRQPVLMLSQLVRVLKLFLLECKILCKVVLTLKMAWVLIT